MFIVSLTYQVELSEIERFLPEHIEYLDAQYALGHFQLSGRKEPRTGGIILATIPSREQLDTVLQQDPFYREKLAIYEVTEMCPTKASPKMSFLL